jgi:hypothetical protein
VTQIPPTQPQTGLVDEHGQPLAAPPAPVPVPEPTPEQLREQAAIAAAARQTAPAAPAAPVTTDGPSAAEVENLGLRSLGVDIADSRLGKMYLAQYAGPMTVEAMQADAIAAGVLPAPDPAQTPAGQIAAARAGLEAPGVLPPATPEERAAAEDAAKSPQQVGLERYFYAKSPAGGGQATEDSVGAFFGTVIGAAVAGDERALVRYTPEQAAAIAQQIGPRTAPVLEDA